jgi:hypothetical protein
MVVDTQRSGQGPFNLGPWFVPEQMHEVAAIVRLLTAVWTIPQVTKVSLAIRETSIDVWVFMSEDNYEAEALISHAERDYINASPPHGFLLHVVPGTDVSAEMLPPSTVILER